MQITLTLNDKKLTADVAPDTLLIDFLLEFFVQFP